MYFQEATLEPLEISENVQKLVKPIIISLNVIQRRAKQNVGRMGSLQLRSQCTKSAMLKGKLCSGTFKAKHGWLKSLCFGCPSILLAFQQGVALYNNNMSDC